jgi:4'-phosphopantetheinyl transferase
VELGWLTAAEAARAERLRYTKPHTEYLLRRLVAKHAVAVTIGRSTSPAALAGIEIRNAPSGAPYVLVDGAPAGVEVSISDRAGWAVCLVGADGGDDGGRGPLGCDLELVEPRSPGFVRDFLTDAEQRFVAGQSPGEPRDAAANLVWSATESVLKVLRTGLRRDTRSVEVTAHPPRADGWGALAVRSVEGDVYPGWWRREGRFLLTVAAAAPFAPPTPLDAAAPLATATPRHSWLDAPLHH